MELADEQRIPTPTVISIILSSDKTMLESFSGGASTWPQYMTIGNIMGKQRFRRENRCIRLIGLLPSFDGTCGLFQI